MRNSLRLLIPATLSVTLLLTACGGANDAPLPVEPAPAPAPASPELEQARKDVAERFKGSADEPTSKDAAWTAHDIFKVAVYSDGYDQRGYAEHVCNVLFNHGFDGQKVWVQIIDYAQLLRADKVVKLGEAHCS